MSRGGRRCWKACCTGPEFTALRGLELAILKAYHCSKLVLGRNHDWRMLESLVVIHVNVILVLLQFLAIECTAGLDNHDCPTSSCEHMHFCILIKTS